MSLRTSTMSMPYSDQPLEAQPEQYHLLRKLAIVLLLVAASSLWLYILFREKYLSFSTPMQEIAAGIVIAIVAGLGTQLMLSQRDGFMRFVVSMTGDVAGVYLLGFVSSGKYGISKFGWIPKAMDYDGLNLIGIGFILILFISLLFRRTRVIVVPEPIQTIPPESESENFSSAPIETSNSISLSTPERPRISWSRLFTPSSTPRTRSNGRHGGMIQPAKTPPAIAPKRRRRNKKARVQLALVEEHRCPYCLDTVVRSDPRGVKECPVCHTLHHKDCWDITGSCQVPHLNT
jgi:ribosomal protein L37AE/L43A